MIDPLIDVYGKPIFARFWISGQWNGPMPERRDYLMGLIERKE
jgi:hypothetical protein